MNQDWVEEVKQLTADIERNAQDSKEKADRKQEILRAQAKRYPLAEIGRLIGVSRERVSIIANRGKHPKPRPTTCKCGNELPAAGPRRIYCSPACRSTKNTTA